MRELRTAIQESLGKDLAFAHRTYEALKRNAERWKANPSTFPGMYDSENHVVTIPAGSIPEFPNIRIIAQLGIDTSEPDEVTGVRAMHVAGHLTLDKDISKEERTYSVILSLDAAIMFKPDEDVLRKLRRAKDVAEFVINRMPEWLKISDVRSQWFHEIGHVAQVDKIPSNVAIRAFDTQREKRRRRMPSGGENRSDDPNEMLARLFPFFAKIEDQFWDKPKEFLKRFPKPVDLFNYVETSEFGSNIVDFLREIMPSRKAKETRQWVLKKTFQIWNELSQGPISESERRIVKPAWQKENRIWIR